MKLGAFSVSLSVKDIEVSKKFYERLGFEKYAGDMQRKYLIMKNGDAVIGLFEGMFEGNILTFNPGWDQSANNLDAFDDIREIQQRLVNSGVSVDKKIESGTSGPANFSVTDPDGNVILFDQHR